VAFGRSFHGLRLLEDKWRLSAWKAPLLCHVPHLATGSGLNLKLQRLGCFITNENPAYVHCSQSSSGPITLFVTKSVLIQLWMHPWAPLISYRAVRAKKWGPYDLACLIPTIPYAAKPNVVELDITHSGPQNMVHRLSNTSSQNIMDLGPLYEWIMHSSNIFSYSIKSTWPLSIRKSKKNALFLPHFLHSFCTTLAFLKVDFDKCDQMIQL